MLYSEVDNLIKSWKSIGFTEEHEFKDEYTLLINKKTMECARIYPDGTVWLKPMWGEDAGKYRRMN